MMYDLFMSSIDIFKSRLKTYLFGLALYYVKSTELYWIFGL